MNQSSKPGSLKDPLAFLSGDSEMGRLIRSMYWSETPLGPAASWPQSLRTTVSLCLASNFPMDVIWGPRHTQIYNDGYRPLCGVKHPRSMGQNFKECWSSAWPELQDAFESAWAGQSAFLENQRTFIDRNGYLEETFFTFSFSPIRDEGGNVGGLFHPVTEMTQKTLAERRLKLLRDLADGSADAKTVEDACARIAKTLTDHPLDLPFVLLYLVKPGGTGAWLAGSAGLAAGMKAHQERADLSAEEHPDFWPLAEVARTGRELLVDDLERRFGAWSCGPYPEPPQSAFVLPITVPGLDHPLALMVAGVSSRRALDEPYRTFYAMLGESVTNALVAARAYAEERRRAEALAELDRAKTAFFSNVSHEFRTPLTLMLGPVAELLAEGRAGFSPAAADQLEVVNRNGQRLLRLVNTLLDFARIEAGRVQAVYESTDLAKLTAELASNFRSACERAGLRLTIDCPSLTEPVFVDREMWEKIVLNLLSNAFKFTFEGEIAVSLRRIGNAVELRVSDTGTGICAADMPRLFERFYRIENARGRTHEGSGIGLALVQELAKLHGGTVTADSTFGRGTMFTVTLPLGVAHLPPDRIGGIHTLASTATGAGPYIEEALRWLPDDKREGDERSQAPDFRELPPVPYNRQIRKANGNRPYVLVADDNADMRQYIVRLLAEHYHVEAVSDGEAALAAVREQPPDLILTDVMMPRLDGFGLLREVRTDPRTLSVPVILLSARAGEESRIDGMEARADDYLVKPFSARELLARVTAHLQMARLRREPAAALQASVQSFMANSLATAYIKDAEGRYVFVNRIIEQKFKRPLSEWIGCTDFDIFPSEQATQLQHNDRMVRNAQAAAEFVETITEQDGLHYYLSLKFPLQDSKGNWLLAGMSLDMTEQKRTETLLAGQKRVLEFVARGRPLAEVLAAVVRMIEEHDPGLFCSVLQLNGEVARVRIGARPGLPEYYMQGLDGLIIEPPYLSPCALALHSGREVVAPDIEADQRWSEQWRSLALDQGLRSCRVTPVLASDGSVTAAFVMYSRLPHSPTQAIGSRESLVQVATSLIGIALERRQWLETLRRNEERLRLIVDSAVDYAIFTVDPAGRVTSWSSGARNLLGYETAEVVCQNVRLVFTPEDRQRGDPEREREKARTQGRAESERWLVRKDGSRFWASGLVMPLKDKNNLLGFLKIMRDMTQQREVGERLQKAEERWRTMTEALQDADRKKDEFLATLAHELRNPLAPLRNGLQVMKLARNDANTVEQARTMMERQLMQMVRLIDDLLDVSRIGQGKVELRKERIELAKVLAQAVENSRPLIEASGHELTIHVPDSPIFINADMIRMVQVFANLLNNAAKYTERGGRITLTVEQHESDVVVRVKDTGVGIPAHMLTKVFDTFAQVDRTLERSQGGLGIGLSLVKGLVEIHGGSVEARSEGRGLGSEFVVRLPLLPSPSDEPRHHENGERAVPAVARRILVADDNRDSATTLAMMLQMMGNDTRTAFDGVEALDVAAEFRPDVILLDIGMPKLNGYDAARRIREQPWAKNVVLVALTGWGQDEDRRLSQEAGFNFHMVKPVEPAAVEKLLAGVRMRTE